MPTEQQTSGKSVTIRLSHNVSVVLSFDTSVKVSRITHQNDVYTETNTRQYRDPTWSGYHFNDTASWKYLVNSKQEFIYFSISWEYFGSLHFQYIIKDCQLTKMTLNEYTQAVDMCHLEHLNNKYRSELASQAPKASHDISQIRSQVSDCDFSIVCGDNVTIPVHTLVLKTYWPYFKTLLETNCTETKDKVLKLDFPESWVRNLIGYLYGEKLELTFDDLTGLMLLGELYQLPGLVEMTSQEILSKSRNELALKEIISGWQRAAQGNNDPVKRFFAKVIISKAKQKTHKESKENIASLCQEFTADDALGLFFDTLELVSEKHLV